MNTEAMKCTIRNNKVKDHKAETCSNNKIKPGTD